MLKPADKPEPPPERPVGELVQQLVEEGKTYARAEFDLAKAIATAKARALTLPAGLIGAAVLLAQAAVVVLALGVFSVLQWLMGSLLAAIVTFLIFGGIAGAFLWYAIKRLREDL
jgi:hypothetical protein